MQDIEYIRDGKSPIPESEITSRVMRANRGKDTKPELALRRALREFDLTGYRLHWKKAPGRPDIAYPKHKVAIFVHGCYWHRCPHCNLTLPKSNTNFWKTKFAKNKERDRNRIKTLEDEGWKVFTFWECMIKENVISCAENVKEFIERR